MKRATTLEEAGTLLDPRPLDFLGASPEGAADPAFYLSVPERSEGALKLPGPMENLRLRLLSGPPDSKVFLSGHVGSGKSTELGRFAVHPDIRERFRVVMLRFEEQEWATLDSAQVLFRLAGALSQAHAGLLAGNAALKKACFDLIQKLFDFGLNLGDDPVNMPLHGLVNEVKEHLKLSELARKAFHRLGEEHQGMLQGLLRLTNAEIEEGLSKDDGPGEVLLIADDLDKVRGIPEQTEIFRTSINALLAPPFRVVYTLPTGVLFGDNQGVVRWNVEHLYPVKVLKKAAEVGEPSFEPEKAYTSERFSFFQALVRARVEDGLISEETVRLAAVYSGGVLREFFRLLREGIRIATYNELRAVDAPVMRYALKDAMLRESVGLYAPDYAALLHVHQTNDLRAAEDRRYLDLSRVIECHNAAPWFEVNPLLWHVLERHSRA